ncbi:MAG: type II toxin-antitoxin system RelE/ParE family toxin [Casimicrobiaceae bacterium]
MIKTFRHRGLDTFFRTGSKAGINPHHAVRLKVQLSALNNAVGPNSMALPNWKLHSLHGEFAGRWSVWVDGNWRLTFAFDGADTVQVDYEDYH